MGGDIVQKQAAVREIDAQDDVQASRRAPVGQDAAQLTQGRRQAAAGGDVQGRGLLEGRRHAGGVGCALADSLHHAAQLLQVTRLEKHAAADQGGGEDVFGGLVVKA